jgi:hypothetical protein
MKRVADYVFDDLAQAGASDDLVITRGGAMFLNHAVGHCSRLRDVCCHHEQACAIAADGFARVANRPAIVSVTTGPGDLIQGFEPKLTARQLPDGRIATAAYEDMSPFRSREELASNMLAPPAKTDL